MACYSGKLAYEINQGDQLNMSLTRLALPSASRFRALTCASLLSAACALQIAAAADADEGGLAEIVVTAQRFTSTVQNTPISISAVTGDQLDAAGITSVEELAHEIPGLSMRTAGPGQTEYEARGLASSGGSSPTVGFYLDDIPLTPPSTSQTGKLVIDPNLYDIDRIELLRGPQGTLYGSGSMGGTVRVITNQPKLGTFEGSVQGTLSDTQGGSGNGGGSFMLNVPLGDTLAIRVVGTDSYRSGWIDRVVLNPFPEDADTSATAAATCSPRPCKRWCMMSIPRASMGSGAASCSSPTTICPSWARCSISTCPWADTMSSTIRPALPTCLPTFPTTSGSRFAIGCTSTA